jgi:hypothetical protein
MIEIILLPNFTQFGQRSLAFSPQLDVTHECKKINNMRKEKNSIKHSTLMQFILKIATK